MIALLERAAVERRVNGYVDEDTRALLAALGIDGIQLETFLHYNGVA